MWDVAYNCFQVTALRVSVFYSLLYLLLVIGMKKHAVTFHYLLLHAIVLPNRNSSVHIGRVDYNKYNTVSLKEYKKILCLICHYHLKTNKQFDSFDLQWKYIRKARRFTLITLIYTYLCNRSLQIVFVGHKSDGKTATTLAFVYPYRVEIGSTFRYLDYWHFHPNQRTQRGWPTNHFWRVILLCARPPEIQVVRQLELKHDDLCDCCWRCT